MGQHTCVTDSTSLYENSSAMTPVRKRHVDTLNFLALTGKRPFPRKWALSALLLFFLSVPTFADTHSEPLPPELQGDFNKRVGETINSITLFTSQNSVSSGAFKIQSSDAPDADFFVTRFPLSHEFGEDGDAVRPLIRGVFGTYNQSQSVRIARPSGGEDFSRLSAASFGVGTGAVWQFLDGFSITPGVDVAYSHVDRKYDFNTAYSQTVLEPFDRQAFNTDVDVLTYSPSAKLGFATQLGRVAVTLGSKYTHLFNDSIATRSNIIAINSATGLWQTTLELLVPLGLCIQNMPLGVHPFFARTDIYGSARSGLSFTYFQEMGADLTVGVREYVSLLEEVRIGGSYTIGESFQGWRVGIGLEF